MGSKNSAEQQVFQACPQVNLASRNLNESFDFWIAAQFVSRLKSTTPKAKHYSPYLIEKA